ncbi:LexA family protein [Streptomyces sp. NPDC057909]
MSAGRPTARQEAVLRAIRDVIADRGDAPTVREIGQRVGLSSSGSVA